MDRTLLNITKARFLKDRNIFSHHTKHSPITKRELFILVYVFTHVYNIQLKDLSFTNKRKSSIILLFLYYIRWLSNTGLYIHHLRHLPKHLLHHHIYHHSCHLLHFHKHLHLLHHNNLLF